MWARWASAGLALALAFAPGAAPAEDTPEGASAEAACDELFPDLRCGRSGRPEGFVKPIVTPYLFEDPFITTGLYPYFIWHEFPEGGAFRGGEAYAVAVQLRVAITDRLAFIATKDGYAWIRPDESLLPNPEGFFDISAGLKYALVHLPEHGLYVSPSLRFDIPVGENAVFSGNGDGVVIPTLSAAWGWERLHLTGALGGRIPFDGGKESTSIFYNLQADFALTRWLSPFVVLSGMHWTSSGNGKRTVELRGPDANLNTVQAVQGVRGFEGWDIVNLGSRGVDGHDVLTMAWGARLKLTDQVWIAAAYERPISDRRHIFRQRMTSSLTFEF